MVVVGRALEVPTPPLDPRDVAVLLSVGLATEVSRVVAVLLSVGTTLLLVSSTTELLEVPPIGEFSVVLSIGIEVVKVMKPLVRLVGYVHVNVVSFWLKDGRITVGTELIPEVKVGISMLDREAELEPIGLFSVVESMLDGADVE